MLLMRPVSSSLVFHLPSKGLLCAHAAPIPSTKAKPRERNCFMGSMYSSVWRWQLQPEEVAQAFLSENRSNASRLTFSMLASSSNPSSNTALFAFTHTSRSMSVPSEPYSRL